jgi:MoxR-like ATPase
MPPTPRPSSPRSRRWARSWPRPKADRSPSASSARSDVVDLSLTALLSGGHALLIGAAGAGQDAAGRDAGHGDGARRQPHPVHARPDAGRHPRLRGAGDGARTARAFRFIEGPIFCQLLMADEINRASPAHAVGAAAGDAGEAGDRRRRHPPAAAPFHVLATQNPIEQEGTYPLPEAQLDRFLVQIDVPYPDRGPSATSCWPPPAPPRRGQQVFDRRGADRGAALVRRMPVGETVVEAILDLVRACRPGERGAPEIVRDDIVAWGPGPRAAQALMLTVRARALLEGRLAPSVEDVIALARPVLKHRMALTFAARAEGRASSKVIDEVTARSPGSRPPREPTPRSIRRTRCARAPRPRRRAAGAHGRRRSIWRDGASRRARPQACRHGRRVLAVPPRRSGRLASDDRLAPLGPVRRAFRA